MEKRDDAGNAGRGKGTLRKSGTPAQIWRGCHPRRAELCSPALSSGGHGGACYMRGGIFLCVTSVNLIALI